MSDDECVYPLFFYHHDTVGYINRDHNIYWRGYTTSIKEIQDYGLMVSINRTLTSLLQSLPPEE